MKLAQSDRFLIANKKKSSKRPVLPLRNSRDARQEGKPVHPNLCLAIAALSFYCQSIATDCINFIRKMANMFENSLFLI